MSHYFDPNSNANKKQDYHDWKSIVTESFVRAISTYFTDMSDREKKSIIKKEMNDGFTMTQYVYDRIPEFETFDGTFSEICSTTAGGISPVRITEKGTGEIPLLSSSKKRKHRFRCFLLKFLT
jgi:hypothetical protein